MRTSSELPPQNRGLTAIAGAMSLIVVLLIVQIWLLSAALETFLAGHRQTSLPAAVFSGRDVPNVSGSLRLRRSSRFGSSRIWQRRLDSNHPF